MRKRKVLLMSCELKSVYELTSKEYPSEDGTRVGYGITAYLVDEAGEKRKILAKFEDITSGGEALSKLVGLCNSLQLSIIHLGDVIEDFLT